MAERSAHEKTYISNFYAKLRSASFNEIKIDNKLVALPAGVKVTSKFFIIFGKYFLKYLKKKIGHNFH